ncbi:MAG: hypothetical protein IT229_08300, partial [Flavobacteriales bacterium]|nr:hypothetical protein [Flavobacteriales bacterium]
FMSLSLVTMTLGVHAQESSGPHTLFADSTAITGGYFAMGLHYTNIFDNDVSLISLGAGMVIDHKLNIGLAGAWSTSVVKNPAYQQHLVDGGQTTDLSGLELKYGYGGLFVEPLLFHRSSVHLALPVLVGMGGVSYSFPTPNNGNDSQRNRTDGQAFFVLEPGLEVEVSVVKALRISLGGSYLYTSDLSLPATSPDALRSAMARMTLKFGQF